VQQSPEIVEERTQRVFWVTGRLRDGVSVADAEAALHHLGERLADAHTGDGERFEVHVMPESEARIEAGLGGAMRLMATILLVLVGLVLLIACGNVANLLLARARSRRREIGLRLAIGAGGRHLVRQLLTESLLVALAGGAAAVGLAFATSRLLDGWKLPTSFPIRFDTTPDARVLLFTLLVSIAAGVLFGLVPALRVARTDLVSALRGTAGQETVRGRMLGSSLVVVQVAMSLVLLVGAALFLRSLQEAQHVDLGMNPQGLLAMTLDTSLVQQDDEDAGRRFAAELERRLAELPGVRDVALAWPVPMDYFATIDPVRPSGDVLGGGADTIQALSSRVGAGYFETVETPLVAGRPFAEADGPEGEPVVIVNETLAARLWPDREALGQTLDLVEDDGPPRRVVGVARDGKYRLLGEGPTPFVYLPWRQAFTSRMTFIVRTSGDAGRLVGDARRTLAELEPDLVPLDVRDLPSLIAGRALSPIQLAAGLAGAFGLVGLVLAAAGLYGVMAYNVAQRTREMGIRLAVGARSGELVRLVILQGGRLVALGLGIGLVLALLSNRVLGSFLVGVEPGDPAVLAAVAASLGLVALLATLGPAMRAARVDPVISLRDE
jgi:predicted permease